MLSWHLFNGLFLWIFLYTASRFEQKTDLKLATLKQCHVNFLTAFLCFVLDLFHWKVSKQFCIQIKKVVKYCTSSRFFGSFLQPLQYIAEVRVLCVFLSNILLSVILAKTWSHSTEAQLSWNGVWSQYFSDKTLAF